MGIRNSVLLFIFISLCSCTRHNNVEKVIERLVGKEIVLPVSLKPYIKNTEVAIPDFHHNKVKIVVYLDSLGCEDCKLYDLLKMDRLLESHSIFCDEFVVLYILHPSSHLSKNVGGMLEVIDFNYPVFIDFNGDFEKENPFLPSRNLFHSFLLNRENKIILVGSPLNNTKMWDLYNRQIQKILKK